MKILIEEYDKNNEQGIKGTVNNHCVICIYKNHNDFWKIGSSSCLPTDIREAIAYIDCMKLVIERLKILA